MGSGIVATLVIGGCWPKNMLHPTNLKFTGQRITTRRRQPTHTRRPAASRAWIIEKKSKGFGGLLLSPSIG